MIGTSITFFIIGLIALAVGFGGVGSVAMNVGWVLLTIGVVMFIINSLGGRRNV